MKRKTIERLYGVLSEFFREIDDYDAAKSLLISDINLYLTTKGDLSGICNTEQWFEAINHVLVEMGKKEIE